MVSLQHAEGSSTCRYHGTMLSTRKALREWDDVRKILADVHVYAAAHPGQSLPTHLSARSERVRHTMHAFAQGLASPLVTWQQLLSKNVSIGSACSSVWL
jgi:hypothetical protein